MGLWFGEEDMVECDGYCLGEVDLLLGVGCEV